MSGQKKDRNKLAMIWVSQKDEEKKFTFQDLKNHSNQAANILLHRKYLNCYYHFFVIC